MIFQILGGTPYTERTNNGTQFKKQIARLGLQGLIGKKDLERIVIIPKDATNKDVMCAFFGEVTLDKCMCIDTVWWNAPYKKGGTDNE